MEFTVLFGESHGEVLYILKNNKMEAVLLSFEEYEHLHNLEEMFEQLEIKSMLEERLSTYSMDNNKSWNEIKEEIYRIIGKRLKQQLQENQDGFSH